MTFFAPPWCALCGLPFPYPVAEDAVCGACASRRPRWDCARAVLRYDKSSRRRWCSALKHGDQTHLAGAPSAAGCSAPAAKSSTAPIW